MPFESNGTFVPAVSFNPGTPATAQDQNSQDLDIASGLTQCQTLAGLSAATKNWNQGGFKLTNLGVGSASGDSVTFGQITGGITAFLGTKFTAPLFDASAAAGTARSVFYQSGTSNRWELRCDATAESGANAGSNLDFYAYGDDGATSTLTATVTRSTGVWNFPIAPTFGGNTVRPPGEIASFGMASAPAGWLVCNGAAVSRTTYAALFAAIGTVWGTGDGSTTFNLPNAQGYFLRGWNSTGSGVDPSRVFASIQADTNGPITGTVNSSNGDDPATFGPGSNSWNSGGTGGTTHLTWSCTNAGTESRPKNIAVLVCIKT